MTAKFKVASTHPLALAIGDEVGTVLNLGDKEISVMFPVYGAQFNLGIEYFDIKEGDAPISVKPKTEPTPAELSQSDLKRIGALYLGVQVPFDSEAQQAIVAVTTQILVDTVMTTLATPTFKGTTFIFSNGSRLRVNTQAEFIAFATWFSPRRQAFYQEVV